MTRNSHGDGADELLELFQSPENAPARGARDPKTRHQRRRTRRRRGVRALIVLIVVGVLLGGLALIGSMFWNQFGDKISETLGWTSNDFDGSGHGEAIITIAPGDIGEDVARSLAEAGVVKTSQAFYELLLVQQPAVEFHPGSYRLQLEMSAQSALDALRDPANRMQLTAMIPEGKTVGQALEIIAVGADIPLEDLQAAAAHPAQFGVPEGVTSLEGWLYPATYEFEPGTEAVEALAKMVGYQIAVLDEFGVPVDDRQRVLTLASIVEREAGIADDFGKVSRVIFNRLEQGMLLQMDSTSQYGYGVQHDGSVWTPTEALVDDNPWNTYVNPGLPVGPIANPGRAAIAAALNPEPGDWLYFVVAPGGTGASNFNVDIQGHQADEQAYRDWCVSTPGSGC